MKLSLWYLLIVIVLAVMAAGAEIGAQLAILGLTLGIFFGTLSLGRSTTGDATTTHPGH